MPAIADATRRAQALLDAGETDAAAAVFDGLIARHPDLGLLRVNRAAVAMLAGDARRPRSPSSQAAAADGHPGLAEVAADPLFAPLAGDPALAALVALPAAPPPAPAPAPVTGGAARVGAGNTAWNPATERLEPRFAFPATTEARVLPAGGPKIAARDLLREHVRRGRAAGNHGDLYDNRDRGHSALKPEDHPQLAHVDLRARGAGGRPRLRAERPARLRRADLRQLLDRDHRRAALAQPAALRA